MALTNEDHVLKGGGECPHCGSGDISGDFVEIDEGKAHQKVGCGECGAVWVDTYSLVSYQTIEQPEDSNVLDTIEYSVCEDCLQCIANGHSDNMTGADNAHLEARMKAEQGGRPGHWAVGVAATEDDPDGTGYDEFSGCACELCNDSLAGSRHGVTLVLTKE